MLYKFAKHLGILILFLGLIIFYAWYGSTGSTYPISVIEAHHLLLETDVPRIILGDQKVDIRVIDQGASQIVWEVNEAGNEQFHFTAILEARSDKTTHISIQVAGPDTGPHVTNRQRLASSLSISKLYTRAMGEQIASKMQHREFDTTKVYPALAIAEVANLSQISAQMNQEGEAFQRKERENIEKAYAKDALHH